MASTQDRYAQNNLQGQSGQAGQQGLQGEKTSFTQLWGEPRPLDKNLNQPPTSGPKSTGTQESFSEVTLPPPRQEGWKQSDFLQEQGLGGLGQGGLGAWDQGKERREQGFKQGGTLPQAHVYNLPGENLRPDQRESEWKEWRDDSQKGEWKNKEGFTDLKGEHERRDFNEDRGDWKDDRRDFKDDRRDFKDDRRDFKDDRRDFKDDRRDFNDDRRDFKDDRERRDFKDDRRDFKDERDKREFNEEFARKPDRREVDERKKDYERSGKDYEKGERDRHFGYTDRGSYTVHGEQEESKMQAARELLDRTGQGKNMAGTENISQGLSEVEAKLHREAERAPDQKSAEAVRDMAGIVGATQKLVLEKDLGDRMQQIAEDAKLAAKEQGVTVNADESSEFGGRVEDHVRSGRPLSEMARDVKDTARQNWRSEDGSMNVPIEEEEVDLLIDDIIDLLAIMKSNEKYNVGIRRIFDLGDYLYAEGASAVGSRTSSGPATQKLKADTKELVGEVSGRQTLEFFLDRLNILVDHLRQDQDARDYLSDLKEFLLEKHPDAEYSEEFHRKARNLIERGRAIIDKWNNKSEVSEFLNAADQFLDSVKNDSEMTLLRERAGILRDDFTYVDQEGKRRIDTDLLSNVQQVVVPILADAIKYIPIPMVQYSDAKMEFEAKDIIVCGYDVVPENIFATFESKTALNLKELETEKFRTKLVLEVKNIRTEVKDIDFYFRRKKFPEITDSGRVSVKLTGRGANLTATFRISQLSIDSVPKFESAGVDFNITSFVIDFDKSTIKHKVLLPMMTGLFKRQIIRSIETAVENTLRPVLARIGKTLSENSPVSMKMGSKLENVRQNIKNSDTHRTLQHRHEMLKGDSLEKKEEKEKKARQKKDTRERQFEEGKERRKENREERTKEKAGEKVRENLDSRERKMEGRDREGEWEKEKERRKEADRERRAEEKRNY